MKTICAWCAKKGITTILSDDTAAPATVQILDGPPDAPVSHGICKPCYRDLFGDDFWPSTSRVEKTEVTDEFSTGFHNFSAADLMEEPQ